ncbi:MULTISPECIES: LPXTG cell wall anchor domain-containing protein [Bacillaceae]|uniref:LPXTG cell wall anchor domain-containing protein n=1 Tax=Evansella alkalicola TaxID=745819 RepID=A0ABS6JY42_9BACI|nr:MULTISPECIES: LPXTG cell wall anchor domain-containing protein [Bacillaceae]MBU9723519.1 LPXTG cell wall anchor domain-containing protein [Bacillus alkalicola]
MTMKKDLLKLRGFETMKNKVSFICGFTAFLLLVMPFSTTFASYDGDSEDVLANIYNVTDGVYGDVRDDVYGEVTEDVYDDVRDDVYGVPDFVYSEPADKVYRILPQYNSSAVTISDVQDFEPDYSVAIRGTAIDVQIPVALLQLFEEDEITLTFGDVEEAIASKNQEGLKSALHRLSLTKNGETSSIDFGDFKVTLLFYVNPDSVEKWEDIAVVYINDDGEKEEYIKPISYDPITGFVTAEVSHFSVYGVFEIAGIFDEEDPDNDDTVETPVAGEEDEETQEEETVTPTTGGTGSSEEESTTTTTTTTTENGSSNGENKLPNTATNAFNLLLVGILFLLAGATVMVFRRKSATAL